MTSARNDRGSAGRGNPAGPFSLYQRLTGRPVGYDQIQRFTKIGQILEVGPEDTAWGLIVAQDAYLVWIQESILRSTRMIKAWCMGILSSILLIGLLVGGTVYARSVHIEDAVARQVDVASDKLSGQLAQQATCSTPYGQTYCDALLSVDGSVAKRQIVEAVAALSEDAASVLASTADLPQALSGLTHLNAVQWAQIRKMSTAEMPNQKGREGR